ncbi:uncharacterized protein RHIMIDRAFT_252499 [Rhizopus microsporus ATCC 52813]|uniref:Uncharacterized protein n=1 Tax=Rhizopus microsporus ATCC 52813 TaxID=1340429 RepID=A0A2G4T7D3_RHIZD|nr:uncharacterized protein RHIMIDRAFT_252499 [Rhizopus microsporus ATCC 52813]PHZ16930.1 hypothetical protein RHIMIDRAFT_252499 [Rhizopus microsporus ATCC 52813]
MAMLQSAVARQGGELERVQAKRMVGGAVIAKLDFSKASGFPKRALDQAGYNGVRPSDSSQSILLVRLFDHRKTNSFVVSATMDDSNGS